MTDQTKSTPLETAQAVLRMLNNMNLAANNAIDTMRDEFPRDSETFQNFSVQMNVVLNGIVSLTTIYEQARQRAQAAEDASRQNREDLAALPTARGAGMRDLSAREVPAAAQPNIDVARRATEIIGQGLQRLQTIRPGGKGPTPAGQETAQEPVRQVTQRELTALEQLVGPQGVLFEHLSPSVHALHGVGHIAPGRPFDVFVENIQSVPVEELVHYPSGFYDTKTDGPQELYFKDDSGMEFLWIFGGDPRQFYVRRNDEWKAVETFSRTMIAMVTQRVRDYLGAVQAHLGSR